MEVVVEFLFDLLFEGIIELSTNKKVPKWIRYSLVLFISLFFLVVVLCLLILGLTILKDNLVIGLIMITLSLVLFMFMVVKYKKQILLKHKNKEKNIY